MSDIFDVSTLDGTRRSLTSGARVFARSTSASGPAVPTPDAAVGGTQDADELRRLQRNLDLATLDLASARRTLRTYRRGVRALVASAAVCGLAALSGIVTAIASSVAGVDASTAVTWLATFGLPATLVSVAGLVAWVRMYRIKYEWRKKDGYTYTTYVVDSKDYVDPEHNVDVAQLKYSNALTKLLEHKG